ncbi:murein biosynthesis integral membrane protein MurJ [Candidatus Velamenicoccus archaeovorus]|nr:murein biosynthesis integral membrane protein MurJ [Candidatus Velamenicoccus archaeovorus]
MSEHKTIFKSAAAISAMTIISRITGFVRDVLIAGVFGTGPAAQAFFVAFRIPNMFRDILGEGAGNAAFVPVFCEYLAVRSRQHFQRLVNSLFTLVLSISLIIAVSGIILADPLIHVVAPGFATDPAKLHLTIRLTQILFPYLVLVVVSAYLMSVANAMKSFAVPAASPVVFNCVLIACLALFIRQDSFFQIYLLALATLLGGTAQVAMQMPSLMRRGVSLRWQPETTRFWKEEGVVKVGRLIVPRLVGTSIYQMNIFIDTIFASLSTYAGEGAIAAIYYANRIIQFPFAIFGVAVSNAALPQMSAHAARKDAAAMNQTLDVCLKSLLLAMLPVAVGILVFAGPVVTAVFERGSFGAYSASITTTALFFYGLGLVSYVGVRFLSHFFYALQDTLTPVKTSAAALVSNVVLNALFIFVFGMKIAGLALASSISAFLNFYLLYRHVRRRTGYRIRPLLEGLFVRVLAASAGCAAAAFFIWQNVFASRATLVSLCASVLVACVVYAGLLWLLGVGELKRLAIWLIRKK